MVYVGISLTDKLIDFLSIFIFIKESQDISNSNAGEAVVLIMRQDVEILVIGLDQQLILFVVLI